MLPSFRPTVFSHGLLLAFLLSCVPVFILFTETRAERERLAQDSRQVFQERLQRLGEHIAKQTAPEFWLERINHSLKKRLYESGTRFHDVAHLSRAMAKALQGSQPCGVPVPRIWGFFPPATSGERPQQCSGLRFEKEYQHFFARLFLEQARGQSESHSVNRVLAGGRWTGQLKAMFGDSISPELFSRAYRGKAFPVLFGGRQYLFLWDFLIRNRRIQGGYYLLLPFEHDQHVKTLEWCLDNWATGPEYPCFLPLNSALGNFPSPALVHSRLLHPEVRAHISLLQQQMFHAGPLFQQMIPFVQLLAPLLGKTLEFGQTRRWRAQLFPVSPLSHHAGLLVVPLNELPPGPLERVSWGITVSWAFGWLLLLIFVFLKDRLPELRVQAQLSLWFLGLIAIPLALSMGSSARLIGDMRSNREDSLKSELRHALQEIELGSTRLGNSYYTEIQRMTVTSTFADELFEAHGHPEKKAAFRDHHWEAMKQRKLPVQGFLIYGHRNFLLSRFDPDVHPDMQNWIQVTLQTIWNRYSQTASPSARFAAIPHLPPSKATGAFADRSFLRFSDGRWFQPGFDPLVIGNRNLILARRFLPIDGLPGYVLIFLWTPEPLFTPYLQKTLARDHFLEDGLPLFRAGFSSRGQGLWDVSSGQNETGFHVPLRSMAEQARFQPIWKKDERRQLLAYAYPSSVLPGYILAGAASLRGIDREIQQELLRLLGLFSGLTVFALALAHLLSRRFSQPVIRMTQGLRAIAQGNLETRIAEFRGDELGVCGRILDNMTQWLRERRTMSRFVSPQVLDLIGEGDYQTAMAGVARRVTILVSDIRNFTTLSETHPPEAIFRMVNRHMEIMTQAIQKHGGAIDRFIGDAVVAVFYADGQAPTYVRGLRAAAAMRLGHEQLQRERSRDGSFSYEIGIGLAEGQVIAGVTGDPNSRLDFSVMGEPLQKAGDYEASSKAGRFSKIIVPEKMKQKISGRFIFSALPGNPGLFELVELEEKHPQTARGNESGSPVALPSALPTNSSLPAQPASESPAALLFGMWSGAGLSRGFWAFLIVWILFPLLLLIPGHTWRERVVTQQRDAGRAKIREQVQIFQNTFDPQSQTEQFLNNSLTRLHRQTGNNRRKLFAAVRTFLPTFRRYFPGMQAYYALHEASGDASRDLPKYGETLTRIFHNGNPGAAPLPRQDVHTFFQVFKTQILYPHIDFPKIHEDVFAHAGIEWKQKQFLPAFGIQNTTDFSRILTHAQGRLFLVNSAQGASYFFWLPFWQEKTWGQADRKPVYLQGMLLLWIPAAELRQDILPELCVRNQKEEGFECSITYQTGSEKRRISTRAFHPDQPLRQVSLPGSATIFNHSDWILAHFNVALEGTYRMIFARRQAAPPGFPGISRLLPLALVWAFFGLLAGCFRHAISTRIDVGIRRQMLGTFVIFLLPGLLAGGVLFRESLLEQYARLVADQQKTLSRELSGLDQGNLLYQGFACGLLDRHTRKREFIERLGSSPESSRPHVELRNDQILLDLYKVVYYLGVQIKSMWVIGLDGPARGLRSDKDLIAVTRNAIQPTLEALDPERGGGSGARISKSALLADEILRVTRSLIPPEKFAGFFAAPVSLLQNVTPGAQGQLVYTRHLRQKDTSNWIFQALWANKSLNGLLLHEWLRSSSHAPHLRTAVGLSPADQPSWCWKNPYLTITPDWSIPNETLSQGPYSEQHETLAPHSPALADLIFLSRKLGRRVHRELHIATTTYLVTAQPGQHIKNFILYNLVPISIMRQVIQEITRRKSWFLVLLVVLSLFLAMRVSEQFLRPVVDLTAAARRVVNRDFTARLQVPAGDEFGHLALAFNSMVKGVAEGKLLSRFVSDSVQAAAQQDTTLKVGQGAHLEMVILFAGLSDFKPLLTSLPPAQLVERLNLYLRTMASCLRAHGGSVDKFIGEKILAVFHPDILGGRHNAQIAALRAARDMSAALQELESWQGHHLGIGMVTGPVLMGILGAESVRLELTVIGDSVNLASRLCDLGIKSHGAIVIEEQTAMGTVGTEFAGTLESLGELKVKGKNRLIPTFRVIPP